MKARCKHHDAGCVKVGDKGEIASHEESCVFALMGGALTAAIDQRIVAEREELGTHPIIRRFDDRLQVLTMDVESVQGQMIETKRVHDEIADLRRDISLLSNQLNDLTARFNAGAVNAYEPQKIFKVKGTFVGHEGQVSLL